MLKRNFQRLLLSLVLIFVSVWANAANITAGNKQSLADIRWQDGEEVTHYLKDTHGKPRILHFWAAWCIPCREEMPKMLEWQNTNSDILVIPLSLDQRMAQSRFFIKKLELNMQPLLVFEEDREKIDVSALPFTLLLSEEGKQLGYIKGIAPWQDGNFNTQVRLLLKK